MPDRCTRASLAFAKIVLAALRRPPLLQTSSPLNINRELTSGLVQHTGALQKKLDEPAWAGVPAEPEPIGPMSVAFLPPPRMTKDCRPEPLVASNSTNQSSSNHPRHSRRRSTHSDGPRTLELRHGRHQCRSNWGRCVLPSPSYCCNPVRTAIGLRPE